jgi:hypothetical protein
MVFVQKREERSPQSSVVLSSQAVNGLGVEVAEGVVGPRLGGEPEE